MSYRPNRLRRPASPKKIQALRLAGWRYSSKRSAWVHRAFNGRVGPVFIDPADDHPRIAESIVIDHQGPRRGSEAPTPDHAIGLEAVSPAYAPLDDEIVIEAVATPAVVAVPGEISELPRRPLDRHRPELARLPLPPRPLDLAPTPPVRDEIQVHVKLSESEEPRLVRVDGRPPRLGEERAPLDGVVVPFKSARAFG